VKDFPFSVEAQGTLTSPKGLNPTYLWRYPQKTETQNIKIFFIAN